VNVVSERDEGLVRISTGAIALEGNLIIPQSASGVVVFAHGSGSSRFSVRNRAVAQSLREAGIGTLLMDLLTQQEELVDTRTAHLRFDIELLADRLVAATQWLARQPHTERLKVGLFGASTGGAAALVAAARVPDRIAAVVSRGGRPDLAGPALGHVQAPTLLIVGGDDQLVIGMNRQAAEQMNAPHTIEIVPGAGHLFEEPGALEEVARLASDWFRKYLR
jgi:putative phosphoribosyl transferase